MEEEYFILVDRKAGRIWHEQYRSYDEAYASLREKKALAEMENKTANNWKIERHTTRKKEEK